MFGQEQILAGQSVLESVEPRALLAGLGARTGGMLRVGAVDEIADAFSGHDLLGSPPGG